MTHRLFFILQTGYAAMALGGNQGWDKILTLPKLKNDTAGGKIRYFLFDGAGGFPTRNCSRAGIAHG